MQNDKFNMLASIDEIVSSILKDMVKIRDKIATSDQSVAKRISNEISLIGLSRAELDAATTQFAKLKACSVTVQSIASCSIIIADAVDQGVLSEDEYLSWAKLVAKNASASTLQSVLNGCFSWALTSK